MNNMNESMPAEGSPVEESSESSPEADFETLTEAAAIKADPMRLKAVQAFAEAQGQPLPDGAVVKKSFKESIKGLGADLSQ